MPEVAERPAKKVQKFRLVSGVHVVVQRDARGQPMRDEDDLPIKHTYRAKERGNDLVESTDDLVKKFGQKFRYVRGKHDVDPQEEETEQSDSDVTPEDDGLDEKTEEELRLLAGDLELDVSKAKSKKSLVKLIREATADT